MLRIGVLRPFCKNKEDNNKSYYPLYGVVKVTNVEPINTKIVPDKSLYTKLVSLIKQSTEEYYNMRLALGYEAS